MVPAHPQSLDYLIGSTAAMTQRRDHSTLPTACALAPSPNNNNGRLPLLLLCAVSEAAACLLSLSLSFFLSSPRIHPEERQGKRR